jgi:hypothetical protein
LLVLSGIKSWFYATVFLVIGSTAVFPGSGYSSTITYAAIHFSDTWLEAHWRLIDE